MNKRITAAIMLAALLLSASGCIYEAAPLVSTVAPVKIEITPEPTLAPTPQHSPTPEPTPEPTPTVEPTPTPIPTPYRSEEYPLTAKSLRTREGGRYAEEDKLNDDPEKFMAVVDIVNQAVFIYEKDLMGQYTSLVREMICSTGIEETSRSPRGTFTMQSDYKRFAYFTSFYCYAQYWSQIRGRIYFHSVPYSERDDRYLMEEEFWKLGEPASHGCVRLAADDAQWIYLYLCPGSTVVITDELEPDEELRARLLPKELPVPDCFEIAS